MKTLNFYSTWLLLWSILYSINLLPKNFHPLYIVLVLALIFSITFPLFYNININKPYLFNIFLHIIPLLLITNKSIKRETIIINFIIIISYIIYMILIKKKIVKEYDDSLKFFKKANNIKELINKYLIENF
jgi:hypothetical protein